MTNIVHHFNVTWPHRSNISKPHHKFLLDLTILVILSSLAAYILVTLPSTGDRIANFTDNAWYLNRGRLFQQGVFYDLYVYNAFLPFLIGLVDFFTHDLAIAGIIVNWFALFILVIGTYLLGRMFFNRPIALLAPLLLVTNPSLAFLSRVIWPYLLFQSVIVVYAVVFYLFISYRNYTTAILIGVMAIVAVFTRLEGVFYFLLVLLGGFLVYVKTHDQRLALRLTSVATILFAIGFGFYLYVFLSNSQPESGSSFAFLELLRTRPLIWGDLSHRWMESLLFIENLWPGWAIAIGVGGVLWSLPRFQFGGWLSAGLIVLNILYLFGITIWPTERIATNSLAFFSLLIASGLWQFTHRWPRAWFVAVIVVLVLIAPGMSEGLRLANRSAPDYRNYAGYSSAQKIDAWLAENDRQNANIYTHCTQIIPYTRSNVHYLFRQNKKDAHDPTVWWNSPQNLLPKIQNENHLFMRCSKDGWFEDWLDYFENPEDYPDQLVEVGRIDEFVFYSVTSRND